MNLTDNEIDSLGKILRAVHLSNWGSRIVDDAHAILDKLGCARCGRLRSKSMGCPDKCKADK